MQKRKIWIKSTIIICAMMLCGCSPEQSGQWLRENKAPDVTEINQDLDEEYISACTEKAIALANGEKESSRVDEQLRYYEIQENGYGIAIFSNPFDSEEETSESCVVLRTKDGGSSWKMNSQMLSLTQGSGELRFVQNHVIIVEYDAKRETGKCMVSHDYGKSFTSFSAGEIVFQSKIYPYGNFRGEITDIDKANQQIMITWKTASPYPFQKEDSNPMTAGYDFDFKLKELIHVEGDVLAHEYISQYYPKMIFPESDRQYLTNEDVQKLLNWTPQFVPKEAVLRYAISEIYARKGFDFAGTVYESYFAEKDWYIDMPKCEVMEADLNSFEKANIDLLHSYEKSEY